jgi:putative transposase
MTTNSPQFHIRPGSEVMCGADQYVITHILDLENVLARNIATRELATLAIKELRPIEVGESPDQKKTNTDLDIEEVTPERWEEAKRRFRLIEPVLTPTERGKAEAIQIAKQQGIGQATLYRWRRDYLNSGLLSSLLPAKPDGGRGRSRLQNPAVEAIIKETIRDYYRTDRHPSISSTHKVIKELCQTANEPVPDYQTVRRRILWQSGRDMTADRYGEKVARELHDPILGSVPDANWPLALVMVDHTELPVMIVDDETRRPIGRPWVTFSIDVYSRVVPGMYLSLDAPSAMSAGMCLSHSILPKEKWLADRGIEADWPCWGVMGILHFDNAKEFRGNMLRAACEEYMIDLHLRPVKTPHYGGYIERLMGTVSEELKDIPGTTFGNFAEKGEYDSEGNAIMTLAELERWLVLFLAMYHHRPHGGIGTSPLAKYREGLLGAKGKPGRGLPARRLDEEKVRIDFMPFDERTIQEYGVQWDLTYYADVLRPWINALDPNHPKLKRKFRFRRDPRDISVLYFLDPNAKRYFPIHYRDLSQPAISLWEYREAKQAARKDGLKNIDERVVFDYAKKMRAEVEVAKTKTKSARRKDQRNAEHEKARKKKAQELPDVSAVAKPTDPPPAIKGYDPDAISAYDDE